MSLNPEGSRRRLRDLWTALGIGLIVLLGCRQEMYDQPRYEPLERSSFFEDGRSARHPPPDTVARGQLRADPHLYRGLTPQGPATTFPFPITREVLERGRERFDIFCAPCHDRVGSGEGMVVRRGFRHPPSFHITRLREAAVGHFFDVITRGFGAMPSYAAQLVPEDRWAVVAYVRALQLSQHASIQDVPPAESKQLQEQTDASR